MSDKRIKGISFDLLDRKYFKVQFRVQRYDKDDRFFYREFIYAEKDGIKDISSSISASSCIKIEFKDPTSRDRNRSFVLYRQHVRLFKRTLDQQLGILESYESLDDEGKRNFGLFESIDNRIVIGGKFKSGKTLNIYGGVFINIKPDVINTPTGIFPGITFRYNDEVSFSLFQNDTRELLDVVEEINFSSLTLQLLQFTPPIQHGKYTMEMREGFRDKSSVHIPDQSKYQSNSFGGIKTY